MKQECWFCKKPVVPSKAWTNKTKKDGNIGTYCTQKCAYADAWGPIYRGSVPVRGMDKDAA